jgi:para-nitrobenzyl esterase
MPQDAPMVRTRNGAVRGTLHGGVSAFKGIPFAEAPFAEHRFQAPVPSGHWSGVRDATAYGPRPPQSAEVLGMEPWNPADGLDCLTVNVWTPDPGGAGLPVMVWIYGGGYMGGYSSQAEYEGTALAASGVVLVTFNYRVGMEGFGAVAGAPANRALLDQVAALRWVQENIESFGGDPSRVTVFGHSAGGGSVASLLAMPMARGLFRRAVVQSTAGTFFSPAFADRMSAAIAARAGRTATMDDLSQCSPQDLLTATTALLADKQDAPDLWGQLAYTPTPFSPVVDGEILPTTPWQALSDGAGRHVDLLVGYAKDEYRLFTAFAGPSAAIGGSALSGAMKTLAPPGAETTYRAAWPDASADDLFAELCSDWLFRMPSDQLAQAHSTGGGTSFVYEITWQSPAMGGLLGACHAIEVPMTFGNLDCDFAKLLYGVPRPDEADRLSRQIRTAWRAFAATGDPGWPAYTTGRPMTHVLDGSATPLTSADAEAVSRDIWAGHRFDPIA